jgi:sec-independent protein translocase protein TatB
MFDVGFWEILLVLILALVVIGPERLPGAARTLGLWVGKGRRYIEGVKSEVEQEFDVSEFKRVIRNQEIQLKELQQKVNQSISADDLLGSHQPAHDIKEEKPATEAEKIGQ